MEPTIDEIKTLVSQNFDLAPGDIDRKTRKEEIVIPRQVAHYLVCNYTSLSLRDIGSGIGGKHHATVYNSCISVQNRIDTDKNFANRMFVLSTYLDYRFTNIPQY